MRSASSRRTARSGRTAGRRSGRARASSCRTRTTRFSRSRLPASSLCSRRWSASEAEAETHAEEARRRERRDGVLPRLDPLVEEVLAREEELQAGEEPRSERRVDARESGERERVPVVLEL